MKLTFRTKTLIAFGIGASLFLTTAFADMLLSSGYDRLKATAKYTAQQLSSGVDSFTLEGLFQVKVDGVSMTYDYSKEKYDFINLKHETHSINESISSQYEHYNYRDNTQSVWKNFDENKLYVNPYDEDHFERYPHDVIHFDNLFQEDGASELERVVDAVVGNLQDLVLVEHTESGGYQFNGSLNEAQVPALINAVSSYLIKNEYNSQRRYQNATHLPVLASDLSIQSVSGQVLENEQGLITNINAELILSGKDDQGEVHTIEASFDITITDVNATVIETPDLSDAVINKDAFSYDNGIAKESNVGTYSNNIVIEQDGQIIKIGERILQIDMVSNDNIVGSLKEIVYEGYEDEYDPIQLTFTGIEVVGHISVIHYTDAEGKNNTAVTYMDQLDSITFEPEVIVQTFDDGGYSYSSTPLQHFNSSFNKVFE